MSICRFEWPWREAAFCWPIPIGHYFSTASETALCRENRVAALSMDACATHFWRRRFGKRAAMPLSRVPQRSELLVEIYGNALRHYIDEDRGQFRSLLGYTFSNSIRITSLAGAGCDSSRNCWAMKRLKRWPLLVSAESATDRPRFCFCRKTATVTRIDKLASRRGQVRIVIIEPDPSFGGGSEQLSLELGRGLHQRGQRALLDPLFFRGYAGTAYDQFVAFRQQLSLAPFGWRTLGASWRRARRLARAIRNMQADVVFSSNVNFPADCLSAARKPENTACVPPGGRQPAQLLVATTGIPKCGCRRLPVRTHVPNMAGRRLA